MARYVLNSNGYTIGSISKIETGPAAGYRFLPMIQRGPSRRSWPTPEAALPRDLRRRGCEIVEVKDLGEAMKAGAIWRAEGLDAMREAIEILKEVRQCPERLS